jgi:hypothetical protein
MIKKRIIVLGCLFLVGVGIGFAVGLLSDEGSKELELTYSTNGGVPYEWEYEIADESIVKFVKNKNINKETELVEGGRVDINYVFKGLKEGKTTITFKYVNIIDGTIDKEEKNTVRVDKNKNISLVAID